MPDSTPAPAPAPQPKRTRSLVNRAHLDELASARKVAAATIDPDHVAALTAVELDPALATQILALAGQTDTAIGLLTGARAGGKEMTTQEKNARTGLIAVLAPIQTAAKRKFSGDQADRRDAYYIGASLASETLDEVLTAARTIRGRLVPGPNNAPPTDVLPGIKADPQIKDLTDAIALYDTKNTAQGGQQSEAGGTLEAINAQIDQIADLRRQIQLAADQAWPWRTPGVATLRKAFLLPADRPMTD